MPRTALLVGAVAASALTLAACAGASHSATGAASTRAATSPTSTATATGSPTPSGSTGSGGPRTPAQLKKALLALADLPSGFAVDPPQKDDQGNGTAASRDAACASLVRLSNVSEPPGTRAVAKTSFSGGQQGPFIDEELDALPSAPLATTFLDSWRKAVLSCHSLTMSMPGSGTFPVRVSEVSAPAAGEEPFAARFTVSSGQMQGMDITTVTSRLDGVLVTMTFVGASPDDVEGATQAAVGKAQGQLGGTAAGA